MSSITVRKVNFDFNEQTELYAYPSMPRISLYTAAFSLTMPYLEPYLIRMMLKAKEKVTDEKLLEDMTLFSQQEGNHFRNHARINEVVRSKFDDETAAELLQIENELKSDYEHFLKDKPLRFNLAYAEGFEAMTCAVALGNIRRKPAPEGAMSNEWRKLMDWHLLEEVEHRTVAFDVYHHVAGGYFYRVFQGVKAQIHYLKYIHRFYAVMLRAKGFKVRPYIPGLILGGGLRYINSFFPWYNPANYDVPDDLDERLAAYAPVSDPG